MKKVQYLIFTMLLAVLVIGFAGTAKAEDWYDGWHESSSRFTKDENGGLIYTEEPYKDDSSYADVTDFQFFVCESSMDVSQVKFYSSNTKVAKIESGYDTVKIKPGDIYCLLYVRTIAPGTSTITGKIGDKEYSFKVIVKPYMGAKMSSVKAVDYKSVKVTWQKANAATGYIVARAKRTGNNLPAKLEVLKQVDGGNTTSATVTASHNVNYGYCVIPKMKVGTREYYTMSEPNYYWQVERMMFYKLTYNNAKITKITPGASKATLNWATNKSIKQYKIYGRKDIYSSWKLLYTENKATVGTHTFKQQAGKSYIYKIKYVFPEYSVDSKERSCYVTKKASKKKKALKFKLYQDMQGGQYGEVNSANRDDTFYYVKGNALHVIVRNWNNSYLYDYKLKSNGKAKSKKKIKLCKYDYWGGVYCAPDGNFYVAVGYSNDKQSKTKTVIKVLKYSSSWKLQKTCSITGDAWNVFGGIVTPFTSGNVRMDMRGNKLYMVTSRIMFSGHQSNISFLIDTKTMKYQLANDSYVSHSFNQYVKFDANNLYVVDHGDAYERGINITVVKNYGTTNAVTKDILPFKIKGKTGDNYTGLKLGGVETTLDNIITVGTSVPQNYKVAGVTGNNGKYKKNVFMTITDKNTLKSKIKWLTTYNPKKSKITVREVRTVKLSDDAIVIMYTTVKKSKSTLHYVVVNNQGNVICKKTYKNMEFTASSQPILYNGAINWVDMKLVYKKVKWYGRKYYDQRERYYYYRIPAVVK